MIIDFCLSHYIELNDNKAKPVKFWAGKQYFGGIILFYHPWDKPFLSKLRPEGEEFFEIFFFLTLANEWETLELLKWLLKAIIAINWLDGDVEAAIIVAEHINEWKCINQVNYYILS